MICITGDLITGILPEDDISPLVSQPYVLPFLEKCTEIAPTFVSLGNHEQVLDEADLRKIERTGVMVLDNRWVRKDKWIIGGLTSACVTDYRKARPKDSPLRYPKVPRIQRSGIPKTDWLDGFIRQDGFHILLSHHPEYFPLIPEGIELMLSGHAHGGQWRYYSPLDKRFHGVYAPGQGLFPALTEGRHQNQIISRGLSNNSLVPRLWNPPELVYINL
jgi:predicted MPP superfamily phosphohydrolase